MCGLCSQISRAGVRTSVMYWPGYVAWSDSTAAVNVRTSPGHRRQWRISLRGRCRISCAAQHCPLLALVTRDDAGLPLGELAAAGEPVLAQEANEDDVQRPTVLEDV